MAEVGVVRLARVAREVAESALPLYSHPRSKRLYTQPQLVAILCLMRYEGWTYREAVVRLAEQRELREALHLTRVPHFTTLQKFLRRLGEEELEGLLAEAAKRLMPKDGAPRRSALRRYWVAHLQGQLLLRASPQGDGAKGAETGLAQVLPPGGGEQEGHLSPAGGPGPLFRHP